MEHRHCRSRSHLLSRRQQNLCLCHFRWSTHSNANTDGHTASNTYTVSYCDSNVNATCYSETNSYAYTDSKSLAKCESNVDSQGNTQASPDAATAPDSPSSATVIREW